MPHFPSLNLSASESWIKGKLRKAPKINQDQPVCETCFESYFDVIIVLLLLLFFSLVSFLPVHSSRLLLHPVCTHYTFEPFRTRRAELPRVLYFYFFYFFYHSNHISLFPDYICVNKPTTLHVFFTQRLCRKMEDCVLWQAANRSYAWNRLISTSKQSTWVLRLHCLAGLSIAFKNISFLYCRSMVCICSENNFTLCLTSFKKRCLNKITSQATVAGVAFRDSAVDLRGRLSDPSHWA